MRSRSLILAILSCAIGGSAAAQIVISPEAGVVLKASDTRAFVAAAGSPSSTADFTVDPGVSGGDLFDVVSSNPETCSRSGAGGISPGRDCRAGKYADRSRSCVSNHPWGSASICSQPAVVLAGWRRLRRPCRDGCAPGYEGEPGERRRSTSRGHTRSLRTRKPGTCAVERASISLGEHLLRRVKVLAPSAAQTNVAIVPAASRLVCDFLQRDAAAASERMA